MVNTAKRAAGFRAGSDVDYLFVLFLEGCPDAEIVPQVPRYYEVPPDVLPARLAHPPHPFRVLEELAYPVGRPLRRMHEVTRDALYYLERYAADVPAYDRLFLPERLCHDKAEALSRGLLQGYRGAPLQGVYLPGAEGRQEEYMYVRVSGCLLLHLGKDLLAFRVVGSGAAREHETAVVVFLREPVRLYDPKGVLEGVEPRHLQQYGFVQGDAEPLVDDPHLLVLEVHVLLGERVYRGLHEELLYRERLGEVRDREYRAVVLLDYALQEMPRDALRRRYVDMAPPQPGAALLKVYEHGGLGGVYDDEVRVEGNPGSVRAVHRAVGLPHLAGEGGGPALQRVVDVLRDLEESAVCLHHLPPDVKADVLEERDHAHKELGDPAAGGGGIDVKHLLPGERPGHLLYRTAVPGLGYAFVVAQAHSSSSIRAAILPLNTSVGYMYGSSDFIFAAMPGRSSEVRRNSLKSSTGRPSLSLDS